MVRRSVVHVRRGATVRRMEHVGTASPQEPSPREKASDREWAVRARSFGQVAHRYDQARPSYPDVMIDDIVAELPGPEVVEVGAGTGKATLLFAARSLRVTCIEPDVEMAAVLRENVEGLDVEIVTSAYEDFETVKQFDGLVAAQSWHWTKPETRYGKAAALLKPSGIFAVFWNRTDWSRVVLAPAVDAVYARHGLEIDTLPAARESRTETRRALEHSTFFADARIRTYHSTQFYSAQEWCDYVASTSDVLILEPDHAAAFLADMRATIEREGDGIIEISRHCELCLAHRNETAA
jgi:SAM-dependent methyltransferase